MRDNRAFWKALQSLTHPLSIMAILLLLFNDHWLRHNYPSWLTGKLGDFTWLLFAPFIAGLFFAVIIPRKIEMHSKIVGVLSIAFIGIWFATAKTIPAIHWLTTETLYAIVAYRGSLRMDVTDLLTLPALLISWHIWQTSAETKVNLKPIGYVAFGLGILGTMASHDPVYFNTAIETICEGDEGNLYSRYYVGVSEDVSNYSDAELFESYESISYISYDGGFSWIQFESTINSGRCSSKTEQLAINPANPDIQYRWRVEESVEKTIDNGSTWLKIHNLSELRKDVRDYGNRNNFAYSYTNNGNRHLSSPVSGIVHTETGNLVLAMSTDGILIITPDGNSNWVTVANYQLQNLQNSKLIYNAFAAQKFLIPTLAFLILVTTIVIIHSSRTSTKFWLGVGWIHWMLLVIFAHKVSNYSDGYDVDALHILSWYGSALLSLVCLAFPFSIWASFNLFTRYRQAFLPILISITLASTGYMLPLLLWTQGLIPRYYVASIFSILLTGCVLWACYTHYKNELPERYEAPKEKRKPKEKV